MSWSRAACAGAVADVLYEAFVDLPATVFDHPPDTLNPPALVVARPTEVRYGMAALGIDEAELPVVCVGPIGGEEVVDELLTLAREALAADPTLAGAVVSAVPSSQRNWREQRIGGADVLTAELILTVQM